MLHAPRVYRAALAACLSAAAAFALSGCVSEPVNTNASNVDPSMRGAQQNATAEFEKNGKDPSITADTYFAAGQLAESENAWPRAIEQYNRALSLKSDHQPALFRLGVVEAKIKQYAKAVEIWKKYISATGGDPTGYANLGFCQELAGQFNEAQNTYEAGIRRNPNNAPCRVNYGLMLARLGRFNQAMHEWEVVLPPAEVHYNLGSAYQAVLRPEEAKAEFHKALELDPEMAEAKARLGELGETVAVAVAVAAPTTAPAAPATQPVASTTQPTAVPEATAEAPDVEIPEVPEFPSSPEMTAEVPATMPTTQPVATTDDSEASAEEPTTQPTAAAEQPTTQPVDVSSVDPN